MIPTVSSPLVSSTPPEILLQFYNPIIQQFLDGGPVSGPLPSLAGLQGLGANIPRDPVQEEKIRILILTTLETWLFFSRNPATVVRLQAAVNVVSDPVQWGNIAPILFGTVQPQPHPAG